MTHFDKKRIYFLSCILELFKRLVYTFIDLFTFICTFRRTPDISWWHWSWWLCKITITLRYRRSHELHVENSSRIIRPVAFDQYYSPQKLAKYVKTLVVDILDGRNETLCVDPCAGNNILYDVLPEPKTRFDIADKKNPVDFLTTNRSTFNLKKETHLAFVMNPPFLMPKQKNGVIKFLNHASTLMHDDEFIICVSPHSMRKWTILSNVSKDLHLEEEHVLKSHWLLHVVTSNIVCVFSYKYGKSIRIKLEYGLS